MAGVDVGKGKKGKNFSTKEERSLCRSFLHILQDLIAQNGQWNVAFWERITKHFYETRPQSSPLRHARSLETKWGHIKHDVTKFCGAYSQVLECRESETSLNDVLERALEFYKDRHPKGQSFVYLHYWGLLKDVPCWSESQLDL